MCLIKCLIRKISRSTSQFNKHFISPLLPVPWFDFHIQKKKKNSWHQIDCGIMIRNCLSIFECIMSVQRRQLIIWLSLHSMQMFKKKLIAFYDEFIFGTNWRKVAGISKLMWINPFYCCKYHSTPLHKAWASMGQDRLGVF